MIRLININFLKIDINLLSKIIKINNLMKEFVILLIFPIIIISIFAISYSIPFLEYNNLIKDKCEITDVIYPLRIPENSTDLQGFIECDCGRRCTTNLGICISVFGKQINSNNEPVLMSLDVEQSYDTCTIQESRCSDGEDLVDRMIAIDNAKITAKTYIDMMNTTIECLITKSNNKLYFNHHYDNIPFYVTSGLSLFLISFVFTTLCCCNSKPNNNQLEG